jgi:hypothetical protein
MEKLIRAVTLLGLALLCITLIFVFAIRPEVESQFSKSNANRVVLVQFRDASDFAQLNFVVTNRGTKWFYVPSELVFETKASTLSLGGSSQNLNMETSLNLLNDAYGIEIDDVWQVDQAAFASLVESAGGVEVANPILQTLDGFEAVTFVFDATDNTPVVLQRFEKVWKQIIDYFGSNNLVNVLTSIGSSSRSSVEQSELAGYLRYLHRHQKDVVYKHLHIDADFALKVQARQRLIDAGVRETLAP